MQRLNKVIEQHGRWADLRIYTDRIEALVQSDFSQSLENAKSLIETICKQICESKDVEIKANTNINQLVKKAFTAIGYPSSTPVTKISSSLATIGQQMGELRNEIGSTSHGKTLEELRERNNKVDEMTKELLIDTTVIIASFLIRNFENENPRTTPGTSEQKILLTHNQDFNDFWDESFGEFFMDDYSYTASEILFYTDNEAYLTELKAFEDDEE
ncbi:MAG: abortive infection family protein [Methanosarcinaceae archaeon]